MTEKATEVFDTKDGDIRSDYARGYSEGYESGLKDGRAKAVYDILRMLLNG